MIIKNEEKEIRESIFYEEIKNDNPNEKEENSEIIYKKVESINNDDQEDLISFYKYSKKAGVATIVCLCLFFLLVPIIVGAIFEIVWSIKCLALKNQSLSNDKILWGLLCLLILPIVPIFVMKSKVKDLIIDKDSL